MRNAWNIKSILFPDKSHSSCGLFSVPNLCKKRILINIYLFELIPLIVHNFAFNFFCASRNKLYFFKPSCMHGTNVFLKVKKEKKKLVDVFDFLIFLFSGHKMLQLYYDIRRMHLSFFLVSKIYFLTNEKITENIYSVSKWKKLKCLRKYKIKIKIICIVLVLYDIFSNSSLRI